jgi:hypothetical protein
MASLGSPNAVLTSWLTAVREDAAKTLSPIDDDPGRRAREFRRA